MTQMIFLNLPVEDLSTSVGFYNALGFPTNPDFTNEQASNAVISDAIVVMLLTKPFFATFVTRPIADTRATVAGLYCLSRDSRAAVDDIISKAVAAGGTETRPPRDLGFMYDRAFSDPDGHIWEVVFMGEGAASPQE